MTVPAPPPRRQPAPAASAGHWRVLAALGLVAAAGCSRGSDDVASLAPPRVEAEFALPARESQIRVPVRVPLATIRQAAEAAIPRQLWAIDQSGIACVKAARLKLGDKRIKVTPDLKCTLRGQVVRGPLTLGGQRDHLRLRMPVSAALEVRTLRGALHETATASAIIEADVAVRIVGDWQPAATVRLAHDWRDPPHVEVAGRRIDLASRTDPKLNEVLRDLERRLPRELARLDLRRQVEAAWRAGFTNISVNRANPEVWMRVTPTALGYGGHRVVGRDLELALALAARTEGFVGDRPEPPAPTPLPPPAPPGQATGLRLDLPILADYRELEPVVLKALNKLNAKGIELPRLGRVEAGFHKATIYPTEGGRVAVGIEADARLASGRLPPVRGTAWLSAVPVNAPGSTRIEWRDLTMAVRTDRSEVNLLIELFRSPAVIDALERALALNLQGDYDKILAKARAAVAMKQVGDFQLAASIDRVSHGTLVATGAGLFLPVSAQGTASLRYAPRAGGGPAAAPGTRRP